MEQLTLCNQLRDTEEAKLLSTAKRAANVNRGWKEKTRKEDSRMGHSLNLLCFV